MIYTYFLIFRLDESIGSPSSSGAGISNGSSGAAEKISIRWDNFNNNNHSSTRISNNNTNIQNAVANSNSPASQQALVINNSNNCMGMLICRTAGTLVGVSTNIVSAAIPSFDSLKNNIL